MNLIDFHVHIDYYQNYHEIFNKYEQNKIYTLFVTNLPQIYEKCVKEFRQSKYVKIAIGYNPQLSNQYEFNKNLFLKLVNTTKYIGEVGLDFSPKYKSTKDKQLERFKYICDYIGSKNNKIVSIHSRKADAEAINILENGNVKFAVFHWYSGSLSRIEQIIKDGYYFSVNTAMLRSKPGREILARIPIDRLLIETDGPYTSICNVPVTPDKLVQVYKELGALYNVSNLDEIVYSNLKRLLYKMLNNN